MGRIKGMIRVQPQHVKFTIPFVNTVDFATKQTSLRGLNWKLTEAGCGDAHL